MVPQLLGPKCFHATPQVSYHNMFCLSIHHSYLYQTLCPLSQERSTDLSSHPSALTHIAIPRHPPCSPGREAYQSLASQDVDGGDEAGRMWWLTKIPAKKVPGQGWASLAYETLERKRTDTVGNPKDLSPEGALQE